MPKFRTPIQVPELNIQNVSVITDKCTTDKLTLSTNNLGLQLPSSGSAPETPEEGTMYYNTDGYIAFYTGANWKKIYYDVIYYNF